MLRIYITETDASTVRRYAVEARRGRMLIYRNEERTFPEAIDERETLRQRARLCGDDWLMVEDRRADQSEPWGYLVCTDSFMSGWGPCLRSVYALALRGPEDELTVRANAHARPEMKHPRLVSNTRCLLRNMRHGDHLAIVDRGDASRWYQPGGFAS